MENVKVASLDADGVYWGMEDKPIGEIAETDVVFQAAEVHAHFLALNEGRDEADWELPPAATFLPGECDLPRGRYRWNAELKRFDPLQAAQARQAPEAPSLDRAFDSVPGALERQGMSLPPAAADWRTWFKRTMDA